MSRRLAYFAFVLVALPAACDSEIASTCSALAEPVALDLSGAWSVQADPEGVGDAERWASNELPAPLTVTVPRCLDVASPDLASYVGKSWWQRRFTAPTLAEGERAWLVFDGVALRARVFLDGVERPVGTIAHDHVRAEFDVTDLLNPGEHLLAVEVDNTILESSIPDPGWVGWWNHTGLIRPVRFEVRPRVDLGALRLDTTQNTDGTWHARVVASVSNAGSEALPGTLRLQLQDEADGCTRAFESISSRTVTVGEADLVVEADLAGVSPWAPGAPHLYRLVATLETTSGTTTRTIRTGFREVRLDGPRALWNGVPLTLRGLNRHEMHPDHGFALPSAVQRADLEDLVALGANAVRLAHYPQSAEVLDLCDELGLLAWVEIPAWQSRAEVLGDDAVFSESAAPFLTAMIEEHRHHPSVLFWGLGNEFPSHTEIIERYCERAAALVRGLDPSRLVVFASDKHELLPIAQVDRCFQHVDVVAINEYYGWYYKAMTDLGPALDALHAAFPSKPVLVSELGTEAILGRANPDPPDVGRLPGGGFEFSEDFQVKFLATHLDQIDAPARADWMLGAYLWVYADFADPHRVGDGRPPEMNHLNLKGLVTGQRERKRAWQLVHDRWNP